MTRDQLRRSRKIVVKVGTSLLAPPEGGVRTRRFGQLAAEIARAYDDGREVVLVSSGAVGLGLNRLGRRERPRAIPERQACASVGQIDLCRRFDRAFARHGRAIGQILLTHAGLADRERFLNARHTLTALVADGIVPLINENDSVATEELRFGDNDQLAARVVNVWGADLLILLTDIDGLHDRHPREPGAKRVSSVERVTPRLIASAGPSHTLLSSGGMASKLDAARTAARYGVPAVIADGTRAGVIGRVLEGLDVGTLVLPESERLSSRKHWIAYSLKPRGDLHLDSGAVRALRDRRASLLPAGVTGVTGNFRIGDLVRCLSPSGREVARGLIGYDREEVERIMGERTSRIAAVLGYTNGDELIHRDDLILV